MINKIQISSIVSVVSINHHRAMEAVDLEAKGQGTTFTFTMPICEIKPAAGSKGTRRWFNSLFVTVPNLTKHELKSPDSRDHLFLNEWQSHAFHPYLHAS